MSGICSCLWAGCTLSLAAFEQCACAVVACIAACCISHQRVELYRGFALRFLLFFPPTKKSDESSTRASHSDCNIVKTARLRLRKCRLARLVDLRRNIRLKSNLPPTHIREKGWNASDSEYMFCEAQFDATISCNELQAIRNNDMHKGHANRDDYRGLFVGVRVIGKVVKR